MPVAETARPCRCRPAQSKVQKNRWWIRGWGAIANPKRKSPTVCRKENHSRTWWVDRAHRSDPAAECWANQIRPRSRSQPPLQWGNSWTRWAASGAAWPVLRLRPRRSKSQKWSEGCHLPRCGNPFSEAANRLPFAVCYNHIDDYGAGLRLKSGDNRGWVGWWILRLKRECRERSHENVGCRKTWDAPASHRWKWTF